MFVMAAGAHIILWELSQPFKVPTEWKSLYEWVAEILKTKKKKIMNQKVTAIETWLGTKGSSFLTDKQNIDISCAGGVVYSFFFLKNQ